MSGRKKTLLFLKTFLSPIRLLRADRAVRGSVSVKHIILESRDLEMHISTKREYQTLDLIIVYKFVVNTIEIYLKI